MCHNKLTASLGDSLQRANNGRPTCFKVFSEFVHMADAHPIVVAK